jgi:hypothetical protein
MNAVIRRALLTGAFCCIATVAQAQDYKIAPPEEELEARAQQYVVRRRVVALLIIGGTLAGGVIGMVSRRRERARARSAERSPGDDR